MVENKQYGAALQPVQFTFGQASSTSLNLGQTAHSKKMVAFGAPAAPAMAGSCGFTTRGSRTAVRQLVSRKAVGRSRASPFASLSLAAATMSANAPSAPSSAPAKKKRSLGEIMDYAGKRALSGGIPGMVAMALQVLSLMWLRTTINYQYRYGTSTMDALKTLYKEGGIPRFYQGLLPALIQVGIYCVRVSCILHDLMSS